MATYQPYPTYSRSGSGQHNVYAQQLPDIDEAPPRQGPLPFSPSSSSPPRSSTQAQSPGGKPVRGGDFDAATIESTAQLADCSIFVTSRGTYRVERIPSVSTGHHHAHGAPNQQPHGGAHPPGPGLANGFVAPAPASSNTDYQYPYPAAGSNGVYPPGNTGGYYGPSNGAGYFDPPSPLSPGTTIAQGLPPPGAGGPVAGGQVGSGGGGTGPALARQISYAPSFRRRPVTTPSPAPSASSSHYSNATNGRATSANWGSPADVGSNYANPSTGTGMNEVMDRLENLTFSPYAPAWQQQEQQQQPPPQGQNHYHQAYPPQQGQYGQQHYPPQQGQQGQYPYSPQQSPPSQHQYPQQPGQPVQQSYPQQLPQGQRPYPPQQSTQSQSQYLHPSPPLQPQYSHQQQLPQQGQQFTNPTHPPQLHVITPNGNVSNPTAATNYATYRPSYPQRYGQPTAQGQTSPPMHHQQPIHPQPSRQSFGVVSSSGGSSLPSLREVTTPSSRTNSAMYSTFDGQIPVINATGEGRAASAISPVAESHYDLQTPVIVHPTHNPMGEHLGPLVEHRSQSDNTSVSRDNVLPGEEILYEGAVQTAGTLRGPFEPASLKVFRNTLSNDLRLYTKVGPSSETYWLKGAKAELVPVYAYDQRSQLVVYIRDTSEQQQQQQGPPGQPQPPIINGPRPTGIFQFDRPQDLFKFQAKLTGEDVVLDISTVKMVKLGRANTRQVENYSSARIQIWHEPRSRRTTQSDTASFVTAGTTLSGPVREKVIANSSRLMVFLGRSEEYLTVFVTDDVEIDQKGGTLARLRARKYGSFSRKTSRPGVYAHLQAKKSSEAAGFEIHGRPFNPDLEEGFDVYKQFDIEFENEQSQLEFVQAWTEVMEARRKQRTRLALIQEDMRKEAFTGKEARKILV